MAERHSVELICDSSGVLKCFVSVSNGAKKASGDLGKFGSTGSAALQKVRKEARSTAAATEQISVSAAGIGAGLGTLAAGAAIAGQAFMTQRRELDLLNRVYGEGAASVIAHTQAIEDNTNFSNQAARTAAVSAATLATNYGFTTEQINELLNISADLAQVQGRDLADTTQRVAAGMRGEAESAEVLGLTLNDAKVATFAAAEGMAGYSTSMTDAERAQVRFLYLQEQTASVNGAAAAAATGAGGAVADLKGQFLDAAEGVGAFMGPLAPAAAELSQVALLLPVVGTGLGNLTTKLKGSATAMKVLGAATGGVAAGLGVVALAAGVAIAAWQQQEDGARNLITAYDDVNKAALANAAITNKAAAGAVPITGGGFFDQLGTTIAATVATGDLTITMGEFSLSAQQATDVAANQAVALAHVTTEADNLTAVQNALNTATNAHTITATDAIAVNANLAQLYAETGVRGEEAERQVAALNAQFLKDGDAVAYGAGVQGVVDNLGNVSAAAADATVAVFAFNDATRAGIVAAADAFVSGAAREVSAMQDAETETVDAANRQASGLIAAAERAASAQTQLANQDGRAAVQAADRAGNEMVRAAERTENQTVNAANAAAEGQINAAVSAGEQQVAAAEAAASGQIAAAEKAEAGQVRAAEQAGRAQVSAATKAAHDSVRQATLQANQQINAADKLEEAAKTGAEAREESIVKSATAAHDALVEAAEDTADREIAAAKRSTEKQLFELERRTAAQARAISAQAGDALQDINDQAAKAIAGGADVGKISNQMARDTAKVYEDQIKDQEALLAKEERAQQQIADREDARIQAANDKKDAATEASAARVAAITETAAKEAAATTEAASARAEAMRKAAARDLADVEKATAREVANITKEAAQYAAKVAVQAANETKRVTESANAGVDAVRESAGANTEAVTAQANAEAAKVAVEQARLVRTARVEADRASRVATREWGAEVKAIERSVTQVVKEQTAAKETAELASLARIDANVTRINADAEAARAQVLTLAAEADAEFAKWAASKGLISQGADGEIRVHLSEDAATMEAMAFLNATFGPGAAVLNGAGVVSVGADFTQLQKDLEMLRNSPGSTSIDIIAAPGEPLGTRRPSAPARQLGGLVPPLHARQGRVVTVGEAGREDVLLPVGSRIRSNPATEAQHAGAGGGITIQISGPVYGMDDFEARVGQAAAAVLSRTLPAALSDRRRSLGG